VSEKGRLYRQKTPTVRVKKNSEKKSVRKRPFSPIQAKDAYCTSKRGILCEQKRPTIRAKETYKNRLYKSAPEVLKIFLLVCSSSVEIKICRAAAMSKETCLHGKRDLKET
jgi:hypothetical protein